jgi:uncharacterized phage-like protein YoqJ
LPENPDDLFIVLCRLGEEIEMAIKRGKTTYISGAMSGWDTIAAEQVLICKKKYPQIKCAVIVPFSENFFNKKNWTPEWEGRMRRVIEKADFHTYLFEKNHRGAYFERDRLMVDLSSEVIAYYDGGTGGTKYSLDYAVKKGKKVINLACR